MTAPRDIEALLFDLGGVLIRIDFERVFAHWAKCAGLSVEHVRSRFAFEETLGRYECGEVAAGEYYAALRRLLAIDIPDHEFDHGWNEIFVGEVPGVAALLESVANRAPMYVFSNTNFDHQRVWSQRHADSLHPMRRVFTSCELGRRKPTPEAFHAVAQSIDVPPERILFFDDSRENVDGALAIGMQAIHVRSIADMEAAISQCQWSTHKENLR